VLTAFLTAVESGDLDGLLAVLAPEAVVMGDGGGVAQATRHPVTGALKVARFMLGLFRRFLREATMLAEPVLVNGDLGLLMDITHPSIGTQRMVMGFAVADGQITAIFNQLNPEKLARVPAQDPARGWRLSK
jgi:RNA polymerase sigma-70 factor (ECF subfamily)